MKFRKNKFILRLITLPFFLALHGVFLGYILLRKCWDWLYYGGESITYNDVINTETIGLVYKMIQDEKLKQ